VTNMLRRSKCDQRRPCSMRACMHARMRSPCMWLKPDAVPLMMPLTGLQRTARCVVVGGAGALRYRRNTPAYAAISSLPPAGRYS
jgi:hypothetical protein